MLSVFLQIARSELDQFRNITAQDDSEANPFVFLIDIAERRCILPTRGLGRDADSLAADELLVVNDTTPRVEVAVLATLRLCLQRISFTAGSNSRFDALTCAFVEPAPARRSCEPQ